MGAMSRAMKSQALRAALHNLARFLSYPKTYAVKSPQRFKIALRSLGLGILAHIKHEEPLKILVYRSRLLALAHCAVHIVPAAGSFALISLNFQGRFIGAELQGSHFATDDVKLAAIQVAAKLHELLIIASLSTIVFHVLRIDLIFGNGVPLGLLGSGWNFPQITWFFSSEFWGGALSSRQGRSWKEHRLVPLLVVSGLVATFAGPSTAVLATPRTSPWAIGGGSFWLNGSEAQLWPTNLDGDALQNYNCSTTEAKIYDPRCPSAGYDFLYQHFKTWWQYPDMHSLLEFNLQDYSMVKRIYASVSDNPGYDTYAVTSHWATAMLQDAKRDLYDRSLIWLRDHHRWDPPYPGYLDLASNKTFSVQTQVPIVRTACMSNLSINITKDTLASPIYIPFPARIDDWNIPREWDSNILNSPVPYYSREVDTVAAIQQYLQSKGLLILQKDGNRTLSSTIPAVVAIPIDLPYDPVAGTELGIIILELNANTTIFNSFACTIDAFWKPGQSLIESTARSNRGYHEFRKDRVRNVVTTDLDFLDAVSTDPWRDIRINSSWYELLSPTLPDSADYGSLRSGQVPSATSRSLMERLLEVVLYPLFEWPLDGLPSVRSVEYAISSYFADGLSRCGSTIQNDASGIVGWGTFRPDDNAMARSLVFKGSPRRQGVSAKPDLLMSHNATEMLMSTVFTGYLLATIGSFDYFAVAVLLLHAAMALSYTMLVVLSRPEIMEALDTIPEMIAMAQNSPPPDNDGLKNTCAGIRNIKTLGRIAIMETSQALDGSDGNEELVLRFLGQSRDVRKIPAVGQKYGSVRY
ncbi:hypothetical protein GGS24DRAFT_441060 [Hypoxylon argillaceum]|nr:hypothetical protein GGS24DRAFT_441060 [Hypoxylon argillaceum]